MDIVSAYEDMKAERDALLIQVRRQEQMIQHLRLQGEADSEAMHQLCDECKRLKGLKDGKHFT